MVVDKTVSSPANGYVKKRKPRPRPPPAPAPAPAPAPEPAPAPAPEPAPAPPKPKPRRKKRAPKPAESQLPGPEPEPEPEPKPAARKNSPKRKKKKPVAEPEPGPGTGPGPGLELPIDDVGTADGGGETLSVVCPEGCGAGDTISLATAAGDVEIVVPDGVEAGQEFEVTLGPAEVAKLGEPELGAPVLGPEEPEEPEEPSSAERGETQPALAMPSKQETRALFDRMDSNGNGGLSLAEIDKAVVELYPDFDHKPALVRNLRTVGHVLNAR